MMVEKLSKVLEGLKNIQFTTSVEDSSTSKKEAMFFCVLAADVLESLKIVNPQNLSFIIESMINLCNDNDSDVRMVADESLNRIIMSLSESSMLKVQVELHNIIKKNGPARCLRAALSRFGLLSCHIRPSKGRAHVQELIPCLMEISKRKEESVHETLASSFENIFKYLGVFVPDNLLKGLIKTFLHNLSSDNAVIRRCSASCIVTMVKFCRKPHIFNCYVLNSLLDCVIPICEENSTELILGVLGCLRLLLPMLICVKSEEGISGSFGLRQRQKHEEAVLSVDRLIQVYEISLHYTGSKDHNVVAAALEMLNQILHDPPPLLETYFLSPAGFSRSYINSVKEINLGSRSGSEMSVAWSLPPVDESLLTDDDLCSQFSSLSAGEHVDFSRVSQKVKDEFETAEEKRKIENLFEDRNIPGKEKKYESFADAGSDKDSTPTPDWNPTTDLLVHVDAKCEEIDDLTECLKIDGQDSLYSPTEEDSCRLLREIDVGNFTDAAVPLIHCARLITTLFLLNGVPGGLKSDRVVRVSIKLLALSSLSAIVKMYPYVLKLPLSNSHTEFSVQEMSDILLYSDHCDPQIRGCVNILIGNFIDAVLVKSQGFCLDGLSDSNSKLSCTVLINVISKSLKDKSSICIRQALSAVKSCLNRALFSSYNTQFLPLLEHLPALKSNFYWLVKVKLVDVLADLSYVCIRDLTNSSVYQDEVVDSVLLPLLGDEDSRVRQAAAESLVRILPGLCHENTTVLNFSRTFTNQWIKWLKSRKETETETDFPPHLCPPFDHLSLNPDDFNFNEKIEPSVSRIVGKLTHCLLVPENKYFLFGYLEALKLLSVQFPTTIYSKGWNCGERETDSQTKEGRHLPSNLVCVVLSLLVSSPSALDLAALSNATSLLGNLFAGLCLSRLKKSYQLPGDSLGDDIGKSWGIFTNDNFSDIAEEILSHVLKVLNIYCCLIDDVPSSAASETPNAFLPLLSPVKKQEKKLEDVGDDKKFKNSSGYRQTIHYSKLHQILKNAYTTYKVSLNKSAEDKFLNLLESTLHTLSIVLEVATVQEAGRYAEEILSYLRTVVSLCATSSVSCVVQLLKSLFGVNLASAWENKKLPSLNFLGFNLFDTIFNLPAEFLSEKVRKRMNLNSLDCKNLTVSHKRRSDWKTVLSKNTDKNWLAFYIRLFEPMIVKSLQLYTITADVKLQANVLRLLNQLVQLRFNYCLFDAKQVFVNFVLSQFDLIEHGQIPEVEDLLPHIFKYLVLLSYQKQHSKPLISIPKILQLCDGLMASDQCIQTHCIPALSPVVEDIFSSRRSIPSSEEKELETQREVLLSMLLRLAEFPAVMDLLSLILNESKRFEEKEKWKGWSRQVIDTLLPLANQDRLRLETFEGQNSFARLLSSLSSSVLRPIDPLLKTLFVEPGSYHCITSMSRWLAKVSVLLETVLFVKEDVLLSRLEEIHLTKNITALMPTENLHSPSDPFNVTSFFQISNSSEIASRFILKVISTVATKISECLSTTFLLQQKLSMFFVCVYHILKSGAFHRIANALQNLLSSERDSLAAISSLFVKMKHACPMLTSQFSYFLALLNYCDQNYWSEILDRPCTLGAKLVQSCGVIALSDYLCENLSDNKTLHFLLANNLEEIVAFSHEIPIKELLVTIQKRKADWMLLTTVLSAKSFRPFDPRFIEKLLRLLEISDNAHSGVLLALLVNKFLDSPRLGLSLLASSIACRQVEFLLTLSKERLLDQIDADAFALVLDFFKEEKQLKRHFTLWSLLKKLGLKVFDVSSTELTQNKAVELKELKSVRLNEDWYFNQVTHRCRLKLAVHAEVPSLLSKLPYEKMVKIMSDSEFNLKILKTCLNCSASSRERIDLQEPDQKLDQPLFSDSFSLERAAEHCTFRAVSEVRDMLLSPRGETFAEKLQDDNFVRRMWEVSRCLTVLLEIIYAHDSDLEKERVETVANFGIMCLEALKWDLDMKTSEGCHMVLPQNLSTGLECCSRIVKSRQVRNFMSVPGNRATLNRFIKDIYHIVSHLISVFGYNRVLRDKSFDNDSCLTEIDVLLTFVAEEPNFGLLPDFLMVCIRDLVVNICRIPELSSHVLKAPNGCDLQDLELLKNFISKFSLIGWSSRQQFEEIWVTLLSVLGCNDQEEILSEDSGYLVQASALAIEGITTLLKSSMLEKDHKRLIHHGRDSLSMKNIIEHLPLIKTVYINDDFSDRTYHFLENLEIFRKGDRFVVGQLSVEYLWTAIKQITSKVDIYERHSRNLKTVGLDLPSCFHLLTELYNQWIHKPSPDIKIITTCLKSTLVISDLFTEIAQFQWLLDFSLYVGDLVISEDSVILPLIILCCCKAAAIVIPSDGTCEKIKLLMSRSSDLPCRLATVRGLLYLLQSYIVCYAVNHTSLPPAGSTFHTDNANFVATIVDTFLPLSLEIVQEFITKTTSSPIEYDCCHWTLLFYLLQHYQSSLGILKDQFSNFILVSLSSKSCPDAVMALLVRGTERLLLTTIVDEKFRDQLLKISLEIASHNSVLTARQGLQLLTMLSFLDKRVKDIRQSVTGQDDHEKVMRDMEKINVLFEKLKRSYPKEAEVVGRVVSYVLADFTASDVLTKVIQEFLSSHQPHQKILAGLLFKVFERAEQSLLEDWVVFSLSSFIQGLPIAMSIWTLNCFFLSAIEEPWLRSLFPLVQSRVRMAEVQDKVLLCLSANLFYNQLKDEDQKQSFVRSFEKAAQVDAVFLDLLSTLNYKG